MSTLPKAFLPCLEDPLILCHNAVTRHGSGRKAAGLSVGRGRKFFLHLGEMGENKKKKKKATCSRGSKAYRRKMKRMAEKCAQKKSLLLLPVTWQASQVNLFSLLWQRMVQRRFFTHPGEVALEVTREEGIGIMNEQQRELCIIHKIIFFWQHSSYCNSIFKINEPIKL